ncbi:hypothetical protein HDU76_001804 [Blyttiomyces sp. JEL0837]|nr:hypothetical protein HDU76_001804 [Blyttiomyces sp. JEL0837]
MQIKFVVDDSSKNNNNNNNASSSSSSSIEINHTTSATNPEMTSTSASPYISEFTWEDFSAANASSSSSSSSSSSIPPPKTTTHSTATGVHIEEEHQSDHIMDLTHWPEDHCHPSRMELSITSGTLRLDLTKGVLPEGGMDLRVLAIQSILEIKVPADVLCKGGALGIVMSEGFPKTPYAETKKWRTTVRVNGLFVMSSIKIYGPDHVFSKPTPPPMPMDNTNPPSYTEFTTNQTPYTPPTDTKVQPPSTHTNRDLPPTPPQQQPQVIYMHETTRRTRLFMQSQTIRPLPIEVLPLKWQFEVTMSDSTLDLSEVMFLPNQRHVVILNVMMGNVCVKVRPETAIIFEFNGMMNNIEDKRKKELRRLQGSTGQILILKGSITMGNIEVKNA